MAAWTLAVSTLLFFAAPGSGQKIDIQVLYESLCGDSLKFITQQLHPAWKDISPYVNLRLVPFGKSASVQKPHGIDFVCQHGPKECAGNKIQSCVLNALEDQDAQVDFVDCFMRGFKKGIREDEDFGQECAGRAGLDWKHVSECFATKLGTELQLEAERITSLSAPKFVPTIIYNGRFNQAAQDDSVENFRAVACTHITQLYPDACRTTHVLQL